MPKKLTKVQAEIVALMRNGWVLTGFDRGRSGWQYTLVPGKRGRNVRTPARRVSAATLCALRNAKLVTERKPLKGDPYWRAVFDVVK